MPRDFGEVFLAGFLDELRHRHFLQLGDVDVALLDRFVMLVHDIAFGGIDLFGNFLGQRKRFAFGLQLGFDFVQRRLQRIVAIDRLHWAKGVRPAMFATGVSCFRFRHDEKWG